MSPHVDETTIVQQPLPSRNNAQHVSPHINDEIFIQPFTKIENITNNICEQHHSYI